MHDDLDFDPVIRTQADLEATWRTLMGPWPFGGHTVWMLVVLADDRVLPHLTQVEGTAEPPDERGIASFAQFLGHLDGDPGDRLAFLLSRPGGPAVTPADRAWASSLYAAARRAGLPCETVHLATEGEVRPLPRDELTASA